MNAGGVQISSSTNQNGISNSGAFFISGGTVNIGGIDNSGEVTVNGTSANINVLSYYQFGGELILQNGGTLDPTSVNVSGGSFGGDGAVVGDVKVTGGVVQAGVPSGSLHIEGAYTQTGGTITFDVDPDGKGGYLKTALVFDPGNSVSISGTKIVFDFLNGANPLAFFDSGAFNLDAFFQESDGSLFSNDFNLQVPFRRRCVRHQHAGLRRHRVRRKRRRRPRRKLGCARAVDVGACGARLCRPRVRGPAAGEASASRKPASFRIAPRASLDPLCGDKAARRGARAG